MKKESKLRKLDDYLFDKVAPYRLVLKYFDDVVFVFPRWVKRKVFHVRNGFDPKDCWGLYINISEYILPRLKHLNDNKQGVPATFCDDDIDIASKNWTEAMDKMILAFEIIIKDDDWSDHDDYSLVDHPEDYEKVEEGLSLFAKHFMNLWD